MVGRRLVLAPRLLVVAALAQRSPVAAVPEETLVASVGDDMVHHCGLHVLALLHALLAERVRTEKLTAGLLPCSTVATAGSGPNLLRVHRLVYVTVLLPIGNESFASRVTAGCVGSCRHRIISPIKIALQVPLQGFYSKFLVSTCPLKRLFFCLFWLTVDYQILRKSRCRKHTASSNHIRPDGVTLCFCDNSCVHGFNQNIPGRNM